MEPSLSVEREGLSKAPKPSIPVLRLLVQATMLVLGSILWSGP